MYAKLVIYDEKGYLYNGNGVSDSDGNTGCRVVPCEVKLFEGKRFTYRKIAVKGTNQFHKMSLQLGCFGVLSSLPFGASIGNDKFVYDDNNPDLEFEFILLSVYNGQGLDEAPVHYITAADSVLFVMNESGKTIDKLVCRNN